MKITSIGQRTLLFKASGTRFALAALSGALFYLAMKLTPVWWAAWLAPVPILLAAFDSGKSEARLLAWLAAGIGLASEVAYYWKTTGPFATIVITLLQILVWGFFVLRTRAVVTKSSGSTIIFAFPLLLAGMDTLVSFFSPHGTWGSYAYTQMDATPVIQVASLAGTPGIVFLVGLFASTVAVIIHKRMGINRPLLAYGLPLFLLLAALGYGLLRLTDQPQRATVKIGLTAIDDFIGKQTPPEKVEAVWRGYEKAVAQLANDGARIVILPEKIEAFALNDAERRKAELAELAKSQGVYLIAGVQLNDGERESNVSWTFNANGELVAEYHKRHMVPFLEGDLIPGHEDKHFEIDGKRYGLAICRDLIFADFGRNYARYGLSAMLAPAWDFYVDAWMATQVAALRGVEGGYAVARAGREGYLNASDRYGRVLARKRSDYLPGTRVVAEVTLESAKPTFYARFGNVFGWLCVAGAILTLLPRRRDSGGAEISDHVD